MKSIIQSLSLVFFCLLAGCNQSNVSSGTENPTLLRITGSETMIPLTQKLAADFMHKHPNISVHVTGGGTGTGVKDITNGLTDICAASRPLTPEEIKPIAKKYNSVGLSYQVAKDALSIYVHPSNPVTQLTLDQVRNLFTGRIKNWKEIGGPDLDVVVFVRPPNSGTYLYFKEHVLLNEPQAEGAQIVPNSSVMIKKLSETPEGIGYGGIFHSKEGKAIVINGIEPSIENVRENRYPITRYLYFYVVDSPKGLTEQFINWVQSPAGQKIVQEAGFISLW